jgi:hypothetical protein
MELGHLLTRSGLTCPEASSKVCHDSFCQSGSSVSLSWVVCYEAFCLHVVQKMLDLIIAEIPPYLTWFYVCHACSSDLFSVVLKYLNFVGEMIYWLPLCCEFALHSAHKTRLCTCFSQHLLLDQPRCLWLVLLLCFCVYVLFVFCVQDIRIVGADQELPCPVQFPSVLVYS